MRFLQRVRGAIGMGLMWAAACGLVGGIPRWVFGFNGDAPFGILGGMFGFVAGVTFSVLLAVAERRRGFHQMSLPRFAGWGAVGGLLISAGFVKAVGFGWGEFLMVAPAFAAASALCASGSLALARRAQRQELTAPVETPSVSPGPRTR